MTSGMLETLKKRVSELSPALQTHLTIQQQEAIILAEAGSIVGSSVRCNDLLDVIKSLDEALSGHKAERDRVEALKRIACCFDDSYREGSVERRMGDLARSVLPDNVSERHAVKCPKCGAESGDNWSECKGACPMPGSPHYTAAAASVKGDAELGILLSALRMLEEATGEKFDDEGGDVAAIEREWKSRNLVVEGMKDNPINMDESAEALGGAPTVRREHMYVVRKGGYFYRPKAQGYTSNVHEAGRFTKEEAWQHAAASEEVTARKLSDFLIEPEWLFHYVNYRGEPSDRRVRPLEFRFGSSKYHRRPQFLLVALDLAKNEIREFAVDDMYNVVGFEGGLPIRGVTK